MPDPKEPDFSDVESGSSSTAPPPAQPAGGQTYAVVKGDSLSKIANTDSIKNPDLIYPGQTIRIPDA